jgi:hypothetical protein
MDSEWVNQPEIQLESDLPPLLRLAVVAAAALFLGWEVIAYFGRANVHSSGDDARLLIVLFICGLLIFGGLVKSNVRWTIRSSEIQIERKRLFGQPRVEIIKRTDITDIIILQEGTEFGLRAWMLPPFGAI